LFCLILNKKIQDQIQETELLKESDGIESIDGGLDFFKFWQIQGIYQSKGR
jgi:hypothetical protein